MSLKISKKIFLLIFLLLTFPSIGKCLDPSAQASPYFDPNETRYMRGDTQTVNNLTAYILGTEQSATSKFTSIGGGISPSTAYWGIRVWKRASDGTETEITDGTPVAVVSSSSGSGILNATWDCPQTSLAPSDAIVVRVYGKWGSGNWNLLATFITEQLGASQLDSATWTVYYYIAHRTQPSPPYTVYYAQFYWGTTTYNSRIEGFSYSLRKIVLPPTNTSFTVLSPILPPEIKVIGDRKYLNIFWTAKYTEWKKEIAAKCYLNCPDPGNDIENNCVSYKSCNSITISGSQGVCSILNPNYNFTHINIIHCKIYDPFFPEVDYKPYVNSTFWALNFTSSPLKNISATVGNSISIAMSIKNLGLLEDNYTINVTPLSNPNFVSVKNNYITVENVRSGELKRGFIEIIPLYSGDTELGIWVYSNSPEWLDCSACPSGFACEPTSQKCSKYFAIKIESGYSSLNEISLAEIILLIFISLVLIYRKGP